MTRTLLIVAVVLSGGAVRADLITPDSISPIPTGWVTNQYKGLGLVFPTPSVSWSIGTYYGSGGWQFSFTDWNRGPDGAPIGPPIQDIQSGYQSASFVMPGTGAPATTDSIRVKVNSPADTVFTLTGYDLAGRSIASRDVLVGASTDSWLTLRTTGMHSFEISSMWAPSVPGPWLNLPNFVMEAVELHPMAAAPEPGSLTLFVLGSLVLAAHPWARRQRRVVQTNQDGVATSPVGAAKVVPSARALAGFQTVQERTVESFDNESLVGIAIDGRLTADALRLPILSG